MSSHWTQSLVSLCRQTAAVNGAAHSLQSVCHLHSRLHLETLPSLLAVGIRSCGTFRPIRKHLPTGLRGAMKTLSEGETKAWQSGQLGCLVWCDKQPVLMMLSTHRRVDDMVSIQNDRGPSQPPVVTKPQVVLDYNVGESGVDTVDQLRHY